GSRPPRLRHDRPRGSRSSRWPAVGRVHGRRSVARLDAVSAALAAPEPARQVDAELLELAVKVGALEPGAFGHAGHAALLPGQVKLEVGTFEGVACLAQRQVERQL